MARRATALFARARRATVLFVCRLATGGVCCRATGAVKVGCCCIDKSIAWLGLRSGQGSGLGSGCVPGLGLGCVPGGAVP